MQSTCRRQSIKRAQEERSSVLLDRAVLGLTSSAIACQRTENPTPHLLSPEMVAPEFAAPDESTELTATSNSTMMVTPVAGHDNTVSSAMTSMSATAAGVGG